MEATLLVINELEQNGIIGKYAIGGAVAATRYIEPIQTYDVYIFVMLPQSPSGLISLSPIYDYLTARGYDECEETVLIEGWPVQFLPVYNPLTEDALLHSIDVQFGNTPTHVMSAEFLAAIMLETGRPKDHARLVQFIECRVIDRDIFQKIIENHGLQKKWDNFQERFPPGDE